MKGLHRNEAEKLENVVLHHVAQRARLVVIARAAFQADGFCDGDLHMVDMGGVPQRLIERIGKAQRHQVLHGFLAEIMVDAEDLVFAENAAQRIVERHGGFQIAADRLFHDDARITGNQAMRLQTGGDIAEERRADGEIKARIFSGFLPIRVLSASQPSSDLASTAT